MEFKFRVKSELTFIDRMIEYLKSPERYDVNCGDLPKWLVERKRLLNFGETAESIKASEEFKEQQKRIIRGMDKQTE